MAGLPVQSMFFDGDLLVIGGRCLYFGCNLRETEDAAATVDVYDGIAASDKQIDTYGFAGLEAFHDAPFNRGVLCEQGIYIDLTTETGGIAGIVYYLPQVMLDAMAVVDFSGSQRYIHRFITQPDIYRGFEET